LKHRLKTDRHGVNVWPYASRMLDESRIKDRLDTVITASFPPTGGGAASLAQCLIRHCIIESVFSYTLS